MKKLLILFFALFVLFSCDKKERKKTADAWADYRVAYNFLGKNQDSAFYYFNKVATGVKDSQQVALAYTNMAIIQLNAGDYFGSQESFMQCLNFLNKDNANNYATIAGTYNELGTISVTLRNFKEAIGFLNQAQQFKPDSILLSQLLNNKATAYQRSGNFTQALGIYQKLMVANAPNESEYARILTNIASTKWLINSKYDALPELLKALKIRQNTGDAWGQSSSYLHLSEYHEDKAPNLAFKYALLMYEKATELNNPDEKLEALQQLLKTAPLSLTRTYFKSYEKLNDSLQTVRAAAKNQFALIRYNVERHKAENLKLQKDNAEKQFQISIQKIIIGGSLLAAVVLISIAVFWYRKKMERQKLETENRIQENQLKVSKRIHDVVANGLYQVMTKIEHKVHSNEDELLDDIEYLYEQSRDISYDKQPTAAEPYHIQIDGLLNLFAGECVKVIVTGNNAGIWTDAGPQLRTDVRMILQELMVNMKKHSNASLVSLNFAQTDAKLHISYHDNGVGLPTNYVYGNGLTNTGNRINAAGGIITFVNDEPRGLLINLSIPIV